jgi:uncharacterized membrane protein
MGRALLNLWEDDDSPEALVYDPVHVASVLVGCLVAMGTLFWVLWALLVFEGGLFTKIIPFVHVVFTSKTLNDFGYEGSPYALGLFEGWWVNLTALVLGLGMVLGIGYLVNSPKRSNPLGDPEPAQK